jgi:hypothetical protein
VKARVKELEEIDGGPDCLDLDYCVYAFRSRDNGMHYCLDLVQSVGAFSPHGNTLEACIEQVLTVLNSKSLIKISVED